MRGDMERQPCLDALSMALKSRSPGPGLLHHTDRGSQYANHDHRAVLDANGMVCSISRRGDCWDNAVAESFFKTLKTELIDDADFATRDDARRAIFEFIEVWYNRQRLHSHLDYKSPTEYEALPRNAAMAAQRECPRKRINSNQPGEAMTLFAWKVPWHPLSPAEAGPAQSELEREVGPLHPLWKRGAMIIGHRQDCDDFAIGLADGGYGVVHLVWHGKIDPFPREFPSVSFFATAEELQRAIDTDADNWE